jgi:dipeptidyl aminopeptidase/acylaminoacyl peptidase
VQNTLLYAKALSDNKIPFEMHIYPRGPHALSLGKAYVNCPYPEVAAWTKDAIRFIESIKV